MAIRNVLLAVSAVTLLASSAFAADATAPAPVKKHHGKHHGKKKAAAAADAAAPAPAAQ